MDAGRLALELSVRSALPRAWLVNSRAEGKSGTVQHNAGGHNSNNASRLQSQTAATGAFACCGTASAVDSAPCILLLQ